MGRVWFQQSVSVDGYSAGPEQSLENPLGVGGMRVHGWQFALAEWSRLTGGAGEGEVNASTPVFQEALTDYGAVVMGRNMFGGGSGPWDEAWTGWWGDDPPYHTPVFVLTHHARDPQPMEGGTTFHFVTNGIESAVDQAKQSAGDRNVLIAGGANTIQQAMRAGLVEEFELHVSPVVMGSGERLLDAIGAPGLEQIRVVPAPGVTHIKYRVLP